MKTTDQQALAAFIESCPGLKWQFRPASTNLPWALQSNDLPSYYTEHNDFEIRIAPGQLTFGVPLSMAHLICNPAGLSEEEITEGGKYRVGLIGDDDLAVMEIWNGTHWTGIPHDYYRYTYRLPAYHPLPKVEVVHIRGIKDMPESTQNALAEMVKLAQKQMAEDPRSFEDKPAAEEASTPRTSKVYGEIVLKFGHSASLARMTVTAETLERELAAANKQIEMDTIRFEEMKQTGLNLEAQNRVLREALNETRQWITDWGPSFVDHPNWQLTRKKIKKALQPLPVLKEETK